MPARNVNLTEHLSAFVDEQVRSGRHQNASEVVREALRRYERDELEAEARREAIREVVRRGCEDMAAGRYTEIRDEVDADALFGRLTRRDGSHSRAASRHTGKR